MNGKILRAAAMVVIGVFTAADVFAGGQKEGAAAGPTTLAISIRTLSNPYQNNYKVGAEAFGKAVGLPFDILTTQADSQKGLADIKAEVARTGGNVVFFIDPNQETDDVAQKAISENPGVELVQWVAGDWDRTKEYNQTREMLIARPDIDGVWCANDDMAMGAISALKESGLAGDQIIHDYIDNTPTYDFTNFYAKWSVAIP